MEYVDQEFLVNDININMKMIILVETPYEFHKYTPVIYMTNSWKYYYEK
jgi:hypothetical protein